jgi:hypothetical protein
MSSRLPGIGRLALMILSVRSAVLGDLDELQSPDRETGWQQVWLRVSEQLQSRACIRSIGHGNWQTGTLQSSQMWSYLACPREWTKMTKGVVAHQQTIRRGLG